MGNVIYKFGDDISTDIIYPGRFMATVLPNETPQYAFADIMDLNDLLINKQFEPKSIIIGGKNFGCGSSREQAVSTLKGHDVIIIARNFARIFIQNSVNLGLQTVICPDIESEVGDILDITGNKINNLTNGKIFEIIPHSATRQSIIDAGGLIEFTKIRLLKS